MVRVKAYKRKSVKGRTVLVQSSNRGSNSQILGQKGYRGSTKIRWQMRKQMREAQAAGNFRQADHLKERIRSHKNTDAFAQFVRSGKFSKR